MLGKVLFELRKPTHEVDVGETLRVGLEDLTAEYKLHDLDEPVELEVGNRQSMSRKISVSVLRQELLQENKTKK
jgi:hypothetical protein